MKAKTKKGTPVWFSLIDDCEPNKGGYYCEIYLSEEQDERIDDFVIHAEELLSSSFPDIEAEQIAEKHIRNITEY